MNSKLGQSTLYIFSITLVLVIILSMPGAKPSLADDQMLEPSASEITVMTRNLYFGADVTPLITNPDFIEAISEIYQDAQNTNYPERAAAIAAEIVASQPHLVGIQEATLWRTGPLNDPAPAETVEVDFVDLILDELTTAGFEYTTVANVRGFDAESPTNLGFDARLTISDVVLARAGLPSNELQITGVLTGTYDAMLVVPPPYGPISLPRQWIAVDTTIGGSSFRLISTHLESTFESIRVDQALELLDGPVQTSLPVILIGDLNSEPGTSGDAADQLINAGFVESWGEIYPEQDGFTCCQASDLSNETSQLDKRIDLVLTKGSFSVDEMEIVGDDPADHTPSGLWPSDHAGVVAWLSLQSEVYLPIVTHP